MEGRTSMNVLDLLLAALSGFATLGIVAALGAWLGRVWEKRIEQAEKFAHDRTLEAQKALHQEELSRLNASLKLEQIRTDEAYRSLLEVTREVDLELRKLRVQFYQELWNETGIVPTYPRADDVTYEDLRKLSERLRSWYYEKGGMFLSREAHNGRYIPLQEALLATLKTQQSLNKPLSEQLSDEHYEEIRRKCSRLRTALSDDIQSRRGPIQTKVQPEKTT
jgi:hypothetical protein